MSGKRKSAGKGLGQEQEPQGTLRGWHLMISGKEMCWGTLLFWVCNLGIMFHNADSCIDFSLAVAATYGQMAPRNLEMVATQSSERRFSSLPFPTPFSVSFLLGQKQRSSNPSPELPRGDGALVLAEESQRRIHLWTGRSPVPPVGMERVAGS